MARITLSKSRPIHAGEIIEEEYRKPLKLSQQAFADALGISRVRYAEIASGKRGVSINTAIRLGQVLGTSPELWLNLQRMVDLWDELHEYGPTIRKLKPLAFA